MAANSWSSSIGQPPFKGARAKIQRAKTHIQSLRDTIQDYLSKRPVDTVITVAQNANAGVDISFRVLTRLGHPDDFAVIFGDAIHNLRSSLDVAMNDAVALVSRKPPVGVYFPFFKTSSDLPSEIARKMRGATVDLMNIVKKFQPYVGGNMMLRGLHDLDIQDKHMLAISLDVMVYSGQIKITETGLDFSKIPMVPVPPDVLFGILPLPPEAQIVGLVKDPDLQPIIAKSLPLGGQPVIETLYELASLAESIVETLETHCAGCS